MSRILQRDHGQRKGTLNFLILFTENQNIFMKINATVLRDVDFSDLEIYSYVIDEFRRRGHEVIFNCLAGPTPTGQLHRLHEFDTPCDLHFLCMHYQPVARYHAGMAEHAARVAFYIFRDTYQTVVEEPNIQPVITKSDGYLSIHAPFPVRPWYIRETAGIGSLPNEVGGGPPGDILWCGMESWIMPEGQTRGEWLDKFQRLLPSHVNFSRYGRQFDVRIFATQIKRYKICISLHGIAETTYRPYEIMHTGSCLVMHRHRLEIPWKPLDDAVVPSFSTPEEAAQVCCEILAAGTWQMYQIRQRQWLWDNYNDAVFKQWAVEAVDRLI
jgi:hypothetical protein